MDTFYTNLYLNIAELKLRFKDKEIPRNLSFLDNEASQKLKTKEKILNV